MVRLSRWQYKTTPKPRVTIRRSDEGPGVENSTPQGLGFETRPEGDQEQQGSDLRDSQDLDNLVPTEQAWPLETIKVEISTPAEFKNTYYEIATIKSPYTFQVSVSEATSYVVKHITVRDMKMKTKSWKQLPRIRVVVVGRDRLRLLTKKLRLFITKSLIANSVRNIDTYCMSVYTENW